MSTQYEMRLNWIRLCMVYGKTNYNSGNDRGPDLDPTYKQKLEIDHEKLGADQYDPPKKHLKSKLKMLDDDEEISTEDIGVSTYES